VCDSGTYRFGPGNELHGLVPALLTAGARNVLATLWPIEDSMGRRFVVNFYKHLVQGGPAVALQRTYADLIAGGVDVRDWAAFVVIGPGRLRPPVPPLLRQ
jgi:CHAT domain-containing protein